MEGPPMSPPRDAIKTPPGIRADLSAVESFAQLVATDVDALSKNMDGVVEDVREMRRQIETHETRNVARERDLRMEVQGVREDVAGLRKEIDTRLDGVEGALKVLVDRIPPAEAAAPPGPITTAFGTITPRTTGQGRSTGLVAGGGLSLAAVLGLLTQLAALPVALQWALALVAAAAAITACVVVGVRMTRRD
jgi:hypothetical protein